MSDVASCKDLRGKIRTAFEALDGVRESVYWPGVIGRDGSGEQGIFWSVETGFTEFVSPRNVRAGAPVATEDAIPCRTDLTIRLWFRYQLDDISSSYDYFLELERFVLVCIASADWTGTSGPKIGGVRREVVADGSWHLVTIPVEVHHAYEGST